MNTIVDSGGLSYSNTYDIEWIFPTSNILRRNFESIGMSFSGGNLGDNTRSNVIKLFCDEAQLPNIAAQTGQTRGVLLGQGTVNYPHTRVFTDFQLGWICDADMTPLKFLNVWYQTIFGEYDNKPVEDNIKSQLRISSQANKKLVDIKNIASEGSNIEVDRSIRLNYPSDYLAKCLISKVEKGASASNSRASMVYTMLEVFPYSIDAVPLSAGTSQSTKVTANFYYSKHNITYNDISNFKG